MPSVDRLFFMLMALNAAAKLANIEKSLNTYFFANLVTTSSIDVHFGGQRSIFEPSGETWVRVDYLLGVSRQWMGTVSSSEKGSVVTGIINLNCCDLIDKRTGISYALATIRDTARAYVTEGTAIAIKDYDAGGTPTVGYFTVLNVTENDVQDGTRQGDAGIAIKNISASGEYVEAFT